MLRIGFNFTGKDWVEDVKLLAQPGSGLDFAKESLLSIFITTQKKYYALCSITVFLESIRIAEQFLNL